MKVAATQISIGSDVEKNLTKCQRMIEEASRNSADIVVFPEFTNISRETATDAKSMYEIAASIPGPFIEEICRIASSSSLHVVLPLAVRGRRPFECFDSTFLIGPTGRIIGEYQKTILHREECDLFLPGQKGLPVYETEIGKIGLYTCMDGIIPETSRVLALNGAQILVNSLNSGAREEAYYIIPSRAVENRTWVVSSNKTGRVTQHDGSEKVYPGGSMIVGPDGRIVGHGSETIEEIVYGHVYPEESKDKIINGYDLFMHRRPDLYSTMCTSYQVLPIIKERKIPTRKARISAVQVSYQGSGEKTLELSLGMCSVAANSGSNLLVLPELSLFDRKKIPSELDSASKLSTEALDQFTVFCKSTNSIVAINLVEKSGTAYYNTLYLLGQNGDLLGSYRKTHLTSKDEELWACQGDEYPVISTEFGDLGLMLGSDILFPEAARILTLKGADVIICPITWTNWFEPAWTSIIRATENHVCIVFANRNDSPVKRGSIIVPVMSPYPYFTHRIPMQMILASSEAPHGADCHLDMTVDLNEARNKTIGPKTDLVRNRRPEYYQNIAEVTKVPVGRIQESLVYGSSN